MTENKANQFTSLNEAEKRSKLRQLAQAKGQLTIWRRGSPGESRPQCRVKDYRAERGALVVHSEPAAFPEGEEILASFELRGMSFFFSARFSDRGEEWELLPSGKFYKSERRRNFRLMTFPLHEVHFSFLLPASYQGGKVVDILRRPGHTGLFKSFLRLVDTKPEGEGEGRRLKLRVQDLSVTGLSAHVGPAELEWLKAGEEIRGGEIVFPDGAVSVPLTRVVYVVDRIGGGSEGKQYKAGLRFDGLSVDAENQLGGKINAFLRASDANKDFEDFTQ